MGLGAGDTAASYGERVHRRGSTDSDQSLVGGLGSSTEPLIDRYSALLVDLDGTVQRGREPVAGAADAMVMARARGSRVVFVTNNASVTPDRVVGGLAQVGIDAESAEVLTSAQAGAREIAARVAAGSSVLVVGGEGLVSAVAAEGLCPVSESAADPSGVVQGWFPGLAWPLLAEAAYTLVRPVPWVVTNRDLTLPTAGGVAPGNGAFVELLATVVGRQPDASPGKPQPTMLVAAAGEDRENALVIGDRLDTDIAGAVAAGLDSLLVLTGVTDLAGLLHAEPHERPTYVGDDLAALHAPQPPVERDGDFWICGSARVSATDPPQPGGDGRPETEHLRALCQAWWARADATHSTL